MLLVIKKVINMVKFLINIYIFKKKVVIVFQMGKVGSTTIYESIKKYTDYYCIHVHRVSKDGVKRVGLTFSEKGLPIPMHLFMGDLVRKHLLYDIGNNNKQSIIVTLVREPVERNFSAYFENIQKWDVNIKDHDDLIEGFINKYEHDVPLEWFDVEFKPVTKIDIYGYPFEKQKGWLIIHNNNMKVLLLKIEASEAEKLRALNEVLGCNNLRLINSNVGDNKDYADAYKGFKGGIKLPDSYIHSMENSKYSQYFYSNRDFEQVRKKYSETQDV